MEEFIFKGMELQQQQIISIKILGINDNGNAFFANQVSCRFYQLQSQEFNI